MNTRTRRTFTAEFKEEAVKLVTEQGYSSAEAAHSLGLGQSTLQKWLRARKKAVSPQMAFPGKGSLNPVDDEVRKLKRELERTKLERDILKKAVGYFASPPE